MEEREEWTGRVNLRHPGHGMLRPGRLSSNFNAAAQTDMGLLTDVVLQTLTSLGYGTHPQLIAGALATVVNITNPEIRKMVVGLITQGKNLYVSPSVSYTCTKCDKGVPEEDTVEEDGVLYHNADHEEHYCGTVTTEEGWSVTFGSTVPTLLTPEQEKEAAEAGLTERSGLILPPGVNID